MVRYLTLTFMVVVSLVMSACGNNSEETSPEPAAELAVIAEPATEESASEEPAMETVEKSSEAVSEEVSAEAETDPATYLVDADASQVSWRGDYTLRTGHTGTIDIAEGELTFAGTTLTGGTITIDMTSMVASSLSGSRADELVEHLMNEDFFEVTTYPTAVLVLNSAEPTGVENQYSVTADLTIKGITNEIVFTTDVTLGDGTLLATSNLEFDRTQWDVIYNSGTFLSNIGDRAIKDEVALQVTLVANSSD